MPQIPPATYFYLLEGRGDINLQAVYDSIHGPTFSYEAYYMQLVVISPDANIEYESYKRNPPYGFYGYITYRFYDDTVVSQMRLSYRRQALPTVLLSTSFAYESATVVTVPEPDITMGGSNVNGPCQMSTVSYQLEPNIQAYLNIFA